jgi:hypothetical protein
MKTDIQEKRIYRYLLGDLPEPEGVELEQQFFTDGEKFEQVWEIENRLVDDYVRDRLSSREKRLFEKNYLASPVHRERLAFAQTLARAVDSSAEEPKSVSKADAATSRRVSFLDFFKGNSWRWATAMVLLLLAAVSFWLLNERAGLREQIVLLKNQQTSEQQRAEDLERQMRDEHAESERLAAEVARLQEEAEKAERSAPKVSPQTERPLVASFFLSPKMLMRSGGEPQPLKVGKEITAVLLQMGVEGPVTRNYQLSLRTVEGTTVWSRASVKARAQTSSSSTISVNIPASRLVTGDYILTLSAAGPANDLQEINRYFLRIIR